MESRESIRLLFAALFAALHSSDARMKHRLAVQVDINIMSETQLECLIVRQWNPVHWGTVEASIGRNTSTSVAVLFDDHDRWGKSDRHVLGLAGLD